MFVLLKVYFLLISISSAQALYFKRKIELFLPCTVFLITISEYISGLFGNLRIGYFFIICLAGLCAVYSLKRSAFDIRSTKTYLITPGLFIFLVAVTLLYQYNLGRMLSEWDEFTHWGVVIKDMYIRNVFGNTPGGNLYFPDYPPGTALFQYFILQCTGVYAEHYLYLAQNLIGVSLLTSVYEKYDFKHWKTLLIFTCALALFPLNFFSYYYHTVYVDALLGIFFGYILYVYFKSPQKSKAMWYQIGMALFSLVLVKESGFGLALICLCIILIDYASIYACHDKVQKAGFLISMTLIPKISWSHLLYRLGISAHFDKGRITLKSVFNVFFTNNTEEYQKVAIGNFWRAFSGTSKSGGTLSTQSYFRYVLILVALLAAVYILNKSKHIIWLAISLFIGYLLYAFYTLLLYLFSHTEIAAVNLASFDRYMYTYVIGMLLCAILLLIDGVVNEIKLRTLASTSLLALCFTMSVSVPRLVFNSRPQIEATKKLRENYMFVEDLKDKLSTTQNKVFIINQYDSLNGLGYWMMRYHLDPVKTQLGMWSIGIPEDDTDTQTVKITVSEWREKLKRENYTHVLLFGIDDTFKNYYQELFGSSNAIKDKTLYQFIPESGKLVEVHP